MKIKIVKRAEDYMAHLDGDTAIWDCGKTAASAIGRLIMTHADALDIELVYEQPNTPSIRLFHNYVLSFYGSGKDVLYPMGATLEQVQAATSKYIASEPSPPFIGDSHDREMVRDILIADYKLTFPK